MLCVCNFVPCIMQMAAHVATPTPTTPSTEAAPSVPSVTAAPSTTVPSPSVATLFALRQRRLYNVLVSLHTSHAIWSVRDINSIIISYAPLPIEYMGVMTENHDGIPSLHVWCPLLPYRPRAMRTRLLVNGQLPMGYYITFGFPHLMHDPSYVARARRWWRTHKETQSTRVGQWRAIGVIHDTLYIRRSDGYGTSTTTDVQLTVHRWQREPRLFQLSCVSQHIHESITRLRVSIGKKKMKRHRPHTMMKQQHQHTPLQKAINGAYDDTNTNSIRCHSTGTCMSMVYGPQMYGGRIALNNVKDCNWISSLDCSPDLSDLALSPLIAVTTVRLSSSASSSTASHVWMAHMGESARERRVTFAPITITITKPNDNKEPSSSSPSSSLPPSLMLGDAGLPQSGRRWCTNDGCEHVTHNGYIIIKQQWRDDTRTIHASLHIYDSNVTQSWYHVKYPSLVIQPEVHQYRLVSTSTYGLVFISKDLQFIFGATNLALPSTPSSSTTLAPHPLSATASSPSSSPSVVSTKVIAPSDALSCTVTDLSLWRWPCISRQPYIHTIHDVSAISMYDGTVIVIIYETHYRADWTNRSHNVSIKSRVASYDTIWMDTVSAPGQWYRGPALHSPPQSVVIIPSSSHSHDQ